MKMKFTGLLMPALLAGVALPEVCFAGGATLEDGARSSHLVQGGPRLKRAPSDGDLTEFWEARDRKIRDRADAIKAKLEQLETELSEARIELRDYERSRKPEHRAKVPAKRSKVEQLTEKFDLYNGLVDSVRKRVGSAVSEDAMYALVLDAVDLYETQPPFSFKFSGKKYSTPFAGTTEEVRTKLARGLFDKAEAKGMQFAFYAEQLREITYTRTADFYGVTDVYHPDVQALDALSQSVSSKWELRLRHYNRVLNQVRKELGSVSEDVLYSAALERLLLVKCATSTREGVLSKEQAEARKHGYESAMGFVRAHPEREKLFSSLTLPGHIHVIFNLLDPVGRRLLPNFDSQKPEEYTPEGFAKHMQESFSKAGIITFTEWLYRRYTVLDKWRLFKAPTSQKSSPSSSRTPSPEVSPGSSPSTPSPIRRAFESDESGQRPRGYMQGGSPADYPASVTQLDDVGSSD